MAQTNITEDLRGLFALDQKSVRCPYPLYSRVRDEVGIPLFVPEINCWLVTRYEDAVQVVRK